MMCHLQRVIAIGLVVSVAACRKNDGLQRVEVQGKVTFQGAPVERGLITFRPTSGSHGPAAGTGIINGKYLIPSEKGPVAGPHEVEIKILEHGPDSARPAQAELEMRGQLQMKSFSQRVEIASGTNRLEFSLPPAPADNQKDAHP